MIKPINLKFHYRSVIALITLVAFAVTTIGADAVWAFSPNPQVVAAPINLSEFKIPLMLGEIRETYQGTKPKTIIHIQDAHCNYSTQQSVKKLISYLNETQGIRLVAMEGGEGDYDLTPFTRIKDASVRESVADYFAREGRVNGAELFAISKPGAVRLEGLEDADLYIKNLNVYRDGLKYKGDIDAILGKLSADIVGLKERVYSSGLRELDAKRTAYLTQKLSLKEYLTYLCVVAEANGIMLAPLANISQLRDAISREGGIDFERSARERELLIDEIQKAASPLEAENLVLQALDLKEGRIRADEFYLYLIEKGESLYIDVGTRYPNIVKYSQYLRKYESLDKYKLFDELEALEKQVVERISQNADEKYLYAASKNIEILKGLFSVSLTREEFNYYTQHKADFTAGALTSFLGGRAEKYGLKPGSLSGLPKLDAYRQHVEEFYAYALKRDEAFLRNVSRMLASDDRIILFTGGFHTENLKELFKKEGYSYIVIMPKGEYSENSPYFKLLSGGMSGMEKSLSEASSGIAILSLMTILAEKAEGRECRDRFALAVAILGEVQSGREYTIQLPDGSYVVYAKEIDGNGITGEEACRLEDGKRVCRHVYAPDGIRPSDITPAEKEAVIKAISDTGLYRDIIRQAVPRVEIPDFLRIVGKDKAALQPYGGDIHRFIKDLPDRDSAAYKWLIERYLRPIHDTKLWRFPEQYDYIKKALADTVKMRARDRSRPIRITAWSLGCSRGAEIISMSAAILEEIASHPEWGLVFGKDIVLEVKGVDIAKKVLVDAQKNIEEGAEFDLPDALKANPEFRRSIKFIEGNIASDEIMGDVISSTNTSDLAIVMLNEVIYQLRPDAREKLFGLLQKIGPNTHILCECTTVKAENGNQVASDQFIKSLRQHFNVNVLNDVCDIFVLTRFAADGSWERYLPTGIGLGSAIALVKSGDTWVQHTLTQGQHEVVNRAWRELSWQDPEHPQYELPGSDDIVSDITEKLLGAAIILPIHIHSPPDSLLYAKIYEIAQKDGVALPPKGEFRIVTHPGTYRDEKGFSRSYNLLIPQEELMRLKTLRDKNPAAYKEWVDHEMGHLLDRVNRLKGTEKDETNIERLYPIDAFVEVYTKGKSRKKPASMDHDDELYNEAMETFERILDDEDYDQLKFMLPTSAKAVFSLARLAAVLDGAFKEYGVGARKWHIFYILSAMAGTPDPYASAEEFIEKNAAPSFAKVARVLHDAFGREDVGGISIGKVHKGIENREKYISYILFCLAAMNDPHIAAEKFLKTDSAGAFTALAKILEDLFISESQNYIVTDEDTDTKKVKRIEGSRAILSYLTASPDSTASAELFSKVARNLEDAFKQKGVEAWRDYSYHILYFLSQDSDPSSGAQRFLEAGSIQSCTELAKSLETLLKGRENGTLYINNLISTFFRTRKQAPLVQRFLEQGAAQPFAEFVEVMESSLGTEIDEAAHIATLLSRFSLEPNAQACISSFVKLARAVDGALRREALAGRKTYLPYILYAIARKQHMQESADTFIAKDAAKQYAELVKTLETLSKDKNDDDIRDINSFISRLLEMPDRQDAPEGYDAARLARLYIALIKDMSEAFQSEGLEGWQEYAFRIIFSLADGSPLRAEKFLETKTARSLAVLAKLLGQLQNKEDLHKDVHIGNLLAATTDLSEVQKSVDLYIELAKAITGVLTREKIEIVQTSISITLLSLLKSAHLYEDINRLIRLIRFLDAEFKSEGTKGADELFQYLIEECSSHYGDIEAFIASLKERSEKIAKTGTIAGYDDVRQMGLDFISLRLSGLVIGWDEFQKEAKTFRAIKFIRRLAGAKPSFKQGPSFFDGQVSSSDSASTPQPEPTDMARPMPGPDRIAKVLAENRFSDAKRMLEIVLSRLAAKEKAHKFGTYHQMLVDHLRPFIDRIPSAGKDEATLIEQLFNDLAASGLRVKVLAMTVSIMAEGVRTGARGGLDEIQKIRSMNELLGGKVLAGQQRRLLKKAEDDINSGQSDASKDVARVFNILKEYLLLEYGVAELPKTRRDIFRQISEAEALSVARSIRADMDGAELMRGPDGSAMIYMYDTEAASTNPYFAVAVDRSGIPMRLVIKDKTHARSDVDHVSPVIGNDLMIALNFPAAWTKEGERYSYIREIREQDMIDFINVIGDYDETTLKKFFFALGVAVSEAYVLCMEDRPHNMIVLKERLETFSIEELMEVGKKAVMNIDRENVLAPRYLSVPRLDDIHESVTVITKWANFCLPNDAPIFERHIDDYIAGFKAGYRQTRKFYLSNREGLNDKIAHLAGSNAQPIVKRLTLSDRDLEVLTGKMRSEINKLMVLRKSGLGSIDDDYDYSPFGRAGLDPSGRPQAVAWVDKDGHMRFYFSNEMTEEFKAWNIRHEKWHRQLAQRFQDVPGGAREMAAIALAFLDMKEITDDHIKSILKALNQDPEKVPDIRNSEFLNNIGYLISSYNLGLRGQILQGGMKTSDIIMAHVDAMITVYVEERDKAARQEEEARRKMRSGRFRFEFEGYKKDDEVARKRALEKTQKLPPPTAPQAFESLVQKGATELTGSPIENGLIFSAAEEPKVIKDALLSNNITVAYDIEGLISVIQRYFKIIHANAPPAITRDISTYQIEFRTGVKHYACLEGNKIIIDIKLLNLKDIDHKDLLPFLVFVLGHEGSHGLEAIGVDEAKARGMDMERFLSFSQDHQDSVLRILEKLKAGKGYLGTLKRAAEARSKQFIESRPGLKEAIDQMEAATAACGYRPWKRLYDALGEDVVVGLIQNELCTVEDLLTDEAQYKSYWPGIARLVSRLAREHADGENHIEILLEEYMPRFKGSFGKELPLYWDDIIGLTAIVRKDEILPLFEMITDLRNSFSAQEFKRLWTEALPLFKKQAKDNFDVLYFVSKELSLLESVITQRGLASFWPDLIALNSTMASADRLEEFQVDVFPKLMRKFGESGFIRHLPYLVRSARKEGQNCYEAISAASPSQKIAKDTSRLEGTDRRLADLALRMMNATELLELKEAAEEFFYGASESFREFDVKARLIIGPEDIPELRKTIGPALRTVAMSPEEAIEDMGRGVHLAWFIRLPMTMEQFKAVIDSAEERALDILRDEEGNSYLYVELGSEDSVMARLKEIAEVGGHSHPRYYSTESSDADVNIAGSYDTKAQRRMTKHFIVFLNEDRSIDMSILRGSMVKGEEYSPVEGRYVARELTELGILSRAPGLIGGWVIDGSVKPEYNEEDKLLKLGIVNMRDALDVRKAHLKAEKSFRTVFENFRCTGIDEIDQALRKFYSSFDGRVFLLGPNGYNIEGVGTADMLAICEDLKDEPIGIFHELAHAAIDAGYLSLETVIKHIEGGEVALRKYTHAQGRQYRENPAAKAHYALRLLQRQLWRSDDVAFTRNIKRTIVGHYTSYPESGIRYSMDSFRSGLWEPGSVTDIRMGNYPVMYLEHKEMWKKGDELLKDGVVDFQTATTGDTPYSITGWCLGLDRNITMEIGGTSVLVADNHNFALPFLVEMRKKGVIADGSAMLHFDHHADLNTKDCTFKLDEYESEKDGKDKLKYINASTRIDTWQRVLYDLGIVDRQNWRWFTVGTGPGKLDIYSDGYVYPEGPLCWMNLTDSIAIPDIAESPAIVDIDIDVLAPYDEKLTADQKIAVLRGEIPADMAEKIKDMARLAAGAKAVTIATSPGYIHQGRALVYTKELLRQMQALKMNAMQPSTNDLGAQVANVKYLGRLLRIFNLFRKTKGIPELPQNATDLQFMEFFIKYLTYENLATTETDPDGNSIIRIKDEALNHSDENVRRLIRLIHHKVVNPSIGDVQLGGAKAVNYKGANWTIVGFKSDLTDPRVLKHERAEIGLRKLGLPWHFAHIVAEERREDEWMDPEMAILQQAAYEPLFIGLASKYPALESSHFLNTLASRLARRWDKLSLHNLIYLGDDLLKVQYAVSWLSKFEKQYAAYKQDVIGAAEVEGPANVPQPAEASKKADVQAATELLMQAAKPALRQDDRTIHTILIVGDEAYQREWETESMTQSLRAELKRAFGSKRGNDVHICRSYKEAAALLPKMEDADWKNTFLYVDPRVQDDGSAKDLKGLIKTELLTKPDGSILAAAPVFGYSAYSQLYASLIEVVSAMRSRGVKVEEMKNDDRVKQLIDRMASVVKEMTMADVDEEELLELVTGLAITVDKIQLIHLRVATAIEEFVKLCIEQHQWKLPYAKAADWEAVRKFFELQRAALVAA